MIGIEIWQKWMNTVVERNSSVRWDRKRYQEYVDVPDITFEIDFAGQVGRNMGEARCQRLLKRYWRISIRWFYLDVYRCRSSTEDMIKMTKIEFENLKEFKKDIEDKNIEDKSKAEDEIKRKEKRDMLVEFKTATIYLDQH